MNRILKISPLGLKVIKAYEGYRSEAKLLVTGQRVIGYGHVLESDEEIESITREAAQVLLLADLKPYEDIVRDHSLAPLNQGQFDALCSIAFNIGQEKFLGSNLLRALNNGRILDAATGFDEWRKAEINGHIYVVDTLMRRRTAEKALFLRDNERIASAARGSVIVESDASYSAISEGTEVFDPDMGLVDYVPYDAKPAPSRRREDSPMGLFGLSEVQDKSDDDRTVFDPQTKAILQSEGLELEAAIEAASEGFVVEEIVTNPEEPEEPFLLDKAIPDMDMLTPSEDESEMLDIPSKIHKPLQASIAHPKISEPSPIAIAAAQVSERLDALIDIAKLQPMAGGNEPPAKPIRDVGVADVRLAANNNADAKIEHKPVRGAEAFIQLKGVKAKGSKIKAKNKTNALKGTIRPYAVFMFIGGCLLAAGIVTVTTNKTNLNDLTSLLVPVALIVGTVMVVSSLYYMLKESLNSS